MTVHPYCDPPKDCATLCIEEVVQTKFVVYGAGAHKLRDKLLSIVRHNLAGEDVRGSSAQIIIAEINAIFSP